jgi:hypothetical protein
MPPPVRSRMLPVYAILTLVLLGVAALPLSAQDVLVLRSGELRTGLLQSCIDGSCFVEGRHVPQRDISYVLLGASDFRTYPCRTNENAVITIDGRRHRGQIDFLNLGEVTIGDRRFERESVSSICLGPPYPRPAIEPYRVGDLLFLLDGTERIGALETCDERECVFDGESIPRSEIAWAGLRQIEGMSPPASDELEPELRLTNVSLHFERVVSMDDSRIRSARATWNRSAVAWIYFGGR